MGETRTCPRCGRSFATSDGMRVHLAKIHKALLPTERQARMLRRSHEGASAHVIAKELGISFQRVLEVLSRYYEK